MDGHVKVSGTWKALEGLHVKVSSVWKEVTSGYVKVSGTWKQFYQNVVYSLANIPSSMADTGAATTTYALTVRFNTDGTVDVLKLIGSDIIGVETFCAPVSYVAGLHVRCSYVSGDNMTGGDAEDTWHAMTSARSFIMQHTSGGGSDFLLGVFNFELSDDGGSTEVANIDNRSVSAGEII